MLNKGINKGKANLYSTLSKKSQFKVPWVIRSSYKSSNKTVKISENKDH